LPKKIPTDKGGTRDPGTDQPRLPYRRPKITRIGADDAPYLSRDERDQLLAMTPRQLHPVLDVHFVVGRSGEVWASRLELADRAGVPPRSFDRHRARLVDLGVLALVWHSSRARDGQPGRNARYRLIRPADVVKVEPTTPVEPSTDQPALARCRWCLATDHDHADCPQRALRIVAPKVPDPDESFAKVASDSEPDHSPKWRVIDAQSFAKVASKASKELPDVVRGSSTDSSATRASQEHDPAPPETGGIATPEPPPQVGRDPDGARWSARAAHARRLAEQAGTRVMRNRAR
jgi:hypothetical protein